MLSWAPVAVTSLSGLAPCALGGDGKWCLGQGHLSKVPLSWAQPVFWEKRGGQVRFDFPVALAGSALCRC